MNLINTCSHMDIFDLCDCLEDDSIDMILADLPYGITACEWDNVIPFDDMWECFKRIIKPRGAVVLTASGKFTYKLVMSNFEWFKYEWVWRKSRISDHIRAKLKPLNKHEMVLVFSDGTVANKSDNGMCYYPQGLTHVEGYKKRNTIFSGGLIGKRPSHVSSYHYDWTNYPDTIINIPTVHNVNGYHVNQKPVALFEYLIRTYTQPSETVFDPCVGSGTTAIAARNTGRNYIVGDSSAEYVQVARDRLDKPYTLPLFDETPTEQEKPEQMTMEL